MSEWITITTPCRKCGEEVLVTTTQDAFESFQRSGETYPAKCEDCMKKAEQEAAEEEARKEADEEATLESAAKEAGVKDAYNLKTPPVRYVAKWIWEHRFENVLLSGQTSSGKSTSAGVVARNLIREGHSVQVKYLTGLLDEWRFVRCDNDNPDAIQALFRRLESTDYLIIDECADKNVNTQSTQEFMFRLLEDVYNGSFHGKVFMLGNFYRGSIGDIFGDDAPARRRIREKFTCGLIDVVKKQIVPIHFNFSK